MLSTCLAAVPSAQARSATTCLQEQLQSVSSMPDPTKKKEEDTEPTVAEAEEDSGARTRTTRSVLARTRGSGVH